ncbi:MAG: glycoside hydrolase family 13 protein [Chitinophagales bacterium]
MKFLFYLLASSITLSVAAVSSAPSITRIDPPNWFVGMNNKSLQLCVYGKNIAADSCTLRYPGVELIRTTRVANPNYLFLDLMVSNQARPGFMTLQFNGAKKLTWNYELRARSGEENRQNGFDPSDLIYLLMPDRFSNGDTANDVWKNSNQPWINRDSMFHRHGGDLQGVLNHLPYLRDLGVTTLWMTPFQQNNQPLESYHGYAITDHYEVDQRLGSVALFQKIVQQAHQSRMKVLMDMVYNHVGSEHWLVKNLPATNWIHQHDTFFKTNYRAPVLSDPYASEFDKNKMSNGWFAKHMPDLNQQNPLLATYLIQNSIWWIETTGIDGFRIDTYTYSDLDFMSELMRAIKFEFPHFTAVGELWDHGVAIQAHYQQDPQLCDTRNTHLDGLLDFQLSYAINEALSKPMDWTGGLARIYYTLAQDFLYSEAQQNVIFLDNHDLSRFYSMAGEDLRKFKMGIGFLLTTRGIPSLYYGTEILMKNYADPDGKVRSDFPGGWPHDRIDKFSATGRNANENEAFEMVRKLAQLRKKMPVLQTGKLTQFVPENDTYVYFRYNDKDTIMVVMHFSEQPQTLNLSRFQEFLKSRKKYTNLLNDTSNELTPTLSLPAMSIQILHLD